MGQTSDLVVVAASAGVVAVAAVAAGVVAAVVVVASLSAGMGPHPQLDHPGFRSFHYSAELQVDQTDLPSCLLPRTYYSS